MDGEGEGGGEKEREGGARGVQWEEDLNEVNRGSRFGESDGMEWQEEEKEKI